MQALILLPTLNRPHLLKIFLKSYTDTKATTPGLALVDHNDPSKEDYLKIEYPPGWTLVLTEGVSMADKVNEVWDRFINLDAVCIVNDDHECQTEGWDQRCLAAITGTNVIGTNDAWVAPRRLCGATWWSTKVLRTVGYLFPKGISHLYIDSVWEFLCAKAQCANILMDVTIKHNHVFKDPGSKKDETHNSIYQPGWEDANKEGTPAWHFQRWLQKDAERDAQKLLDIQPKTGLMVATPTHDGNVIINYAMGLVDLAIFFSQQNVYFEMARVVGSSLIPHARNSLVDMFLKSRCQKLLFIDSDQGFDKQAVLHLFQSNKRIIAGVTPHKRFPMNLNFEPLPEDHHFFKDLTNKSTEEFITWAQTKADPKGEIEVNRSGTGFMLIDRSVFEIMTEFFRKEESRIQDFKKKIETLIPDIAFEYADIISGYLNQEFGYEPFDNNPTVKHQEFFKMGALPDEKGGVQRYRGEDWKFTELAKKLKIPIYINANSIVSHHGGHAFSMGIGPAA